MAGPNVLIPPQDSMTVRGAFCLLWFEIKAKCTHIQPLDSKQTVNMFCCKDPDVFQIFISLTGLDKTLQCPVRLKGLEITFNYTVVDDSWLCQCYWKKKKRIFSVILCKPKPFQSLEVKIESSTLSQPFLICIETPNKKRGTFPRLSGSQRANVFQARISRLFISSSFYFFVLQQEFSPESG